MPRKITYADSGVDRKLRARAKASLEMLKETYRYSVCGSVLQLPYGNIFPFGGRYLDLVIEGVGTKVLLAQLVNKYDTIGVDGVAMAVNDVLRSGAKPLALADNIHAQVSDPQLVGEWIKGLVKGAAESRCVVVGGEIGDVPEIISGIGDRKGFDMVVSCVGEVGKDHVVFGDNIKPEDAVIGLRSSGIHSNGITLARKILFKEWGGKFDPYESLECLDRELIYEVLEPTRIYVEPVQEAAERVKIKGAVHITGDGYLKFDRLINFSGVGFKLDNFKPQPVFGLIKETAEELGGIADEEMFKTFNMGWGFALIVDKEEKDEALDILEKSGAEAEAIGRATSTERIVAVYKSEKLVLK